MGLLTNWMATTSTRSRDASGDAGDPTAGTASAAAVHTTALPTTPRKPSAAGAPRPDLGSGSGAVARPVDRGRTSIAAGTPGEHFQSHVLSSLHSLVAFSPFDPLGSRFPGVL
jgi:hypothetical protein